MNNVYLYSLQEYCQSLDSTNTKTIYVKDKEIAGHIWPQTIGRFKIVYLGYNNYKKLIPKKGSITVVGIGSLDYRDGDFSVGVTPFSATYSKKNIQLTNGGGLIVYFEYDSEKKGFKYKSKIWAGI